MNPRRLGQLLLPINSTRSIVCGQSLPPFIAQFDEIKGKVPKPVLGEEHNQNQGGFAETESSFEVTVNAQGLHLTWQNIDTVQVNYCLMDVELLFSTSPFVQRGAEQFATIQPNAREVLKLPGGRNKHTVPLPAQFEGKNVLIEVTGGGKNPQPLASGQHNDRASGQELWAITRNRLRCE
jgi:hypothetical protein